MTFSMHHRFCVQPELLGALKSHCESSEDAVWIGAKRAARPQRLRRWFLRGVPGKQLDLALLEEWDGESRCAIEIGRKAGKYGGERWQLVFRHWYAGDKQPLPSGTLMLSPDEDSRWAAVAASWQGGSWMECFERLQTDLSDYDPKAIVLWHWRHYYSVPLSAVEDLDSLIAEFLLVLRPSDTLAQANRLASRILYRVAVDKGWRKLTARDQERFRMTGQWHLADAVQQRRADMGYPSGAGQYTIEAAAGEEMHETEEDGFLRTSHGIAEVE